MFDFLHEIVATIRRNKMRTFLTGFAVAWGIFMLIVLLASGNGLRNGVMSNYGYRAINTVRVSSGWTSVPYKGFQSGRAIYLDQRDYDLIRSNLPNVEYLSASIMLYGTISYGEEYGTWVTNGVTSDAQYIYNLTVPEGQGRFLNPMDIEMHRKVIVISDKIQNSLFKDEEPLGKYVRFNNTLFQVVGVYLDEMNRQEVYIPFSTAQMIYNQGYGIDRIEFTVTGLKTLEENEAYTQRVRDLLSALHQVDPSDRYALRIYNSGEDALGTQQVFRLINLFVLLIGIASLMAGIVGVGNIMLITVKERTREIGIRKAIGATPGSILKLIIFESIFITTTAGYAGIVLGIGLTELVSSLFFSEGAGSGGVTIFLNPTVDLGTVFGATLFLIGCGVVAGLIPALKATRVRPIEAMRAE
ncbi:MAG: ABC transporter permease [Rikenellaceae bacterium]|jgi:putative ABC transport system permease protein|nr:ABC transporter permease [Rikenellaceae bacterium]MDR0955301.1 ABC transporter permease [Rikenellaceae bacterium]